MRQMKYFVNAVAKYTNLILVVQNAVYFLKEGYELFDSRPYWRVIRDLPVNGVEERADERVFVVVGAEVRRHHETNGFMS